MIEISLFCNQVFNSVSYRIGNCLIDPGDEWEGFYDVNAVLLTHAHFDHIYGLNRVIELNPNARIYTNESGREMLLNARKNLSFYHETPFSVSNQAHIVTVNDSEDIEIEEKFKVRAVFTPGHNPSCITWIIDNLILTGDSFIPGYKVITKLPEGDKLQSLVSMKIIEELAKGRIIYPGHKV